MSEQSRDDEFLKAFLSGDSELSRRYRETGAEEPPAHVDAAIIASARWAVGADRTRTDGTTTDRTATDRTGADQPGSNRDGAGTKDTNRDVSAGTKLSDQADKTIVRQHNFLAHWRIPLATAAVVVIAATLTLMVERNPESDHSRGRDDSAPVGDLARSEPESTGQAHITASEQQPEVAEQVPETAVAKSAASARPAPANELANKDSTKAEAAKRQIASAAATKPAETKPAAPVKAAPKPTAPKSTAPAQPASTVKETGKSSGAEPVATQKEERAAATLAAREAAEPKPPAAAASASETVQQTGEQPGEQADGGTAPGRDTDTAAASYAGAAFPNAGNLGANSGERLEEPSTLADVNTPAQTASQGEQAFAGTSDESMQAGSMDSRDPQQWIKDINELLAQGKRTQAIDSLKAFRRKYPDYQLKPELRALLPADLQ